MMIFVAACYSSSPPSWTSLLLLSSLHLLLFGVLFGGGRAAPPFFPKTSNGVPTKDVVVDYCMQCVGRFGAVLQELNNVTVVASSISDVVHKKSDRLFNAILGWRWSVQPMLIEFVEQWLKDENLSKSYEMWRGVIDSPGVIRALQNRHVQEQLKCTAANILSSHVSQSKLYAIQVAMNATTEIAIDIIEKNIGEDKETVMQIMVEYASDADTVLQSIVSSRATAYFISPDYSNVIQFFSENRILPRLLLPSMAAVLCGFDMRTDKFLNAIVGAYAMKHLTREKALSILAFLDEILGSGSIGKETLPSVMKLLVCSTSSANDMESDLGRESLEFFSGLRRALESSGGTLAISNNQPKMLTRGHPLSTEVRLLIALTRVLRLGKRPSAPCDVMWGGWFPVKLLNRSFWNANIKGTEYDKNVGEKQQQQQLNQYAAAAKEAGIAQHLLARSQQQQQQHQGGEMGEDSTAHKKNPNNSETLVTD